MVHCAAGSLPITSIKSMKYMQLSSTQAVINGFLRKYMILKDSHGGLILISFKPYRKITLEFPENA